MAITKIADLINPEVMAPIISAKVREKLVVTPFAKIDTTLQGQAGDTVTVPSFGYIGDAVDVEEAGSLTADKLTATSTTFKIKMAMKAVDITDQAVLSGYGNPVGEATTQLGKAIASKVDKDAMDALTTLYNATTAPHGVQKVYNAGNAISYAGIVNAIDSFEEEVQSEKAMFVHPKQVTQLRLDSNFISADKYNKEVILKGEIGMIAGTRIVPSKRVKTVDGAQGSRTVTIGGTVATGDKFSIGGVEVTCGDTQTPTAVATLLKEAINALTTLGYTASNSSGVITLTEKTGFYGIGLAEAPALAKTSTSGTITAGGTYSGTALFQCPIIKLNNDSETEDEAPALTVFLKRDTNVETKRHTIDPARTTEISVDKMYGVAITNQEKVVLAKFNSIIVA